MGVYGDSLAVEGGEGLEDGEGDEETHQGDGEADQRHQVDKIVELHILRVQAGAVICPAPRNVDPNIFYIVTK